MANLLIFCFFLVILAITGNSIPNDFKVTGQKIIKIKEHDKIKDVLIIKKGVFSGPVGRHHHSSSPTNDATEDPISKEESSESQRSSSSHLGGHGTHGKSVAGSCVVPRPEPIELYSKFAKIMITHRMFVLASNQHYGDMASMGLTGKPLSAHDPSEACFRVMTQSHRGQLSGFGKKMLYTCEYEEVTEVTCTCTRNVTTAKSHSLQMTFVWSDGRAHILVIMCDNGKGAWAIFSNTRSIDRSSREASLQVAESYGFDPADVIDYTFTDEDCAVAIRDEFTEGKCPDNDDELVTLPQSQAEAAFNIFKEGVYTPLSSLSNVYGTGMFIRGAPLRVTEDLDQVCVKDHWFENGEIMREGFQNQKAYLQCDMKDFTRIKCVPNEEKAASGSATYIYNKHIHPVWTDEKTYVLTLNCLSINVKTWALYSSTMAPLDHDTKMNILSKVADYGLDPLKGHESSYKECAN